MVNWNSYWCYMIISFLIILLSIVQPSDATISCYECSNCSDPFSVSSATTASSCNACYKLSVNIAYAPFTFVIRRCLLACLETYQTFGGGTIISACCATNLCNTSSIPQISHFFIFIFIILNFFKYFFN